MNKKRIFWIIGGVMGGFACLAACAVGFILWQFASSYSQIEKGAALVGNPAPDFTLQTLDQQTVTLSQSLDKPLFLCFGATWCPSCRTEAPLLQELHNQYPDLRVIWVDSKEDQQVVSGFLAQEGYTFLTLLDKDGEVSRQYMVTAIPTTFVIGMDGVIKARYVDTPTQEQIEETLGSLGIEP